MSDVIKLAESFPRNKLIQIKSDMQDSRWKTENLLKKHNISKKVLDDLSRVYVNIDYEYIELLPRFNKGGGLYKPEVVRIVSSRKLGSIINFHDKIKRDYALSGWSKEYLANLNKLTILEVNHLIYYTEWFKTITSMNSVSDDLFIKIQSAINAHNITKKEIALMYKVTPNVVSQINTTKMTMDGVRITKKEQEAYEASLCKDLEKLTLEDIRSIKDCENNGMNIVKNAHKHKCEVYVIQRAISLTMNRDGTTIKEVAKVAPAEEVKTTRRVPAKLDMCRNTPDTDVPSIVLIEYLKTLGIHNIHDFALSQIKLSKESRRS